MCYYTRNILNKKYLPNKKNGGNVPQYRDPRVLYVPVGCGECLECRRQKAQAWRVRLLEEFKTDNKCYFVTLSFSPEALKKIGTKLMEEDKVSLITNIECNAVATKAVRYFLERWRKKYKKSLRHWLITELGDNYTERIHLHGILWTNEKEDIEKIWSYGNVYIGDYCNEKTINYVIKYITKVDIRHKDYKNVVLCSAGIGKGYIKSDDAKRNKFNGTATREYYRLNNGRKINLPIYYRNKIYNEDEREVLWLLKLGQHRVYINGVEHSVKTDAERFVTEQVRLVAQRDNIALGYGSPKKEWQREDYNITLRMLNKYNK